MENSKKTAKSSQNSSQKNTQNSKATQNTQGSQNTQNTKPTQNTQNTKSTQKNSTTSKPNQTKNCAASVSYKAECAQSICKLTDKDIISDVLGSQKSLITLYSTALCESSCKNMRSVVTQKLAECAEDQFDMFLYMNERGMYPTENATAQKLAQAKQLYEKEKTKMC